MAVYCVNAAPFREIEALLLQQLVQDYGGVGRHVWGSIIVWRPGGMLY